MMSGFKNHMQLSGYREAAILLLIAVVYFVSARVGLLFAFQPENLASFWPPSGIALALLLLRPQERWPTMLLVLAFVNWAANLATGNMWSTSLGFAVANSLEPFLAATLIHRFVGHPLVFNRLPQMIGFFLTAPLLGNALTALVGATVVTWSFAVPFASAWLTWWTADALGMLLFTPLIITWAPLSHQFWNSLPSRMGVRQVGTFWATQGAVALLAIAVFFSPSLGLPWDMLTPYLLSPLLIAIAMLVGLRGTTVAAVIFATIAVSGTAYGGGGFAASNASATVELTSLQIYLALTISTALALAAAVVERMDVITLLREREELLAATGRMARIGGWKFDPHTRDVVWSEEARAIHEMPSDIPLSLDTIAHYYDEETRSVVNRQLSEALEHEQPFTIDMSMVTASGKQRRIRLHGEQVAQDDPFILGTIQDITQQYETEKQLRISEARYRTLVAHLPDTGVLLFDSHLRFVLAAGPVFAQAGWNLSAIEGRTLYEILPPARAKTLAAHYNAALSDVAQSFEYDVQDRTYAVEILSLHDQDGGPGGMLVVRDITQRQRTEQALREREAHIRAISDHLPSGCIYQLKRPAQGAPRFLYISAGVERILGVSAEAIMADINQFSCLVLPEDLRLLNEAGDHAHTTVGVMNIQIRIITPQHEQKTIQLTSSPRLFPDGSTIWDGILTDVTQRIVAERTLERQVAYAQALASCSQALLLQGETPMSRQATLEVALAALLNAIQANSIALFEQIEDDEMELRTQLVAEVFAPATPLGSVSHPTSDQSALEQRDERVAQPHALYATPSNSKSLFSIPLRLAGRWWGYMEIGQRSATIHWDEPTTQLLRTAAEMIVTFLHGWSTAQALREAEARQRTMIHALPDTIFRVSIDGTFLDAHTPQPNTLYAPSEVFVGQRIEAILPTQLAVQVRIALAQLAPGGDIMTLEYSLPFGNQQRSFEARLAAINDYERILIVRDMTERAQARAAIEQARDAAQAADRAKSEFLANMSHEIRTPLNAVIGMTSLLQDTQLTEEQREYVEIARVSGNTLLNLINHILDFSKIEARHIELEEQPFDIRTCIDEALDVTAPQARIKRLDLLADIDFALPPIVLGDVTRVRQVLVNLLSNAVKFTEHGEVVLTVRVANRDTETDNHTPTSATRREITFSVRDTGIGIPRDKQAGLFQAFKQVDASTTRKYGGTGLGLAISQQLVHLMGGSLDVVSAPGHGSLFTFRLPITAVAQMVQLPDAASLKGRHALVIDDNATSRQILADQLPLWGMAVSGVESGEAALAWLAKGGSADVILLDEHMPKMDGIATARALRAQLQSRTIPIVLIASDYRNMPATNPPLVDATLLRPVKVSQLVATVQRILGNHQLQSHPVAEPPPQPLRVLVAEDNTINQKVALYLLDRLGYQGDTATNGREAVVAVQQHAYDVILMDVQMPELDGIAATRMIRSLGDRVHQPTIIALTANALQGDRERYLEAGMNDYLSKPITLDALGKALAHIAHNHVQQSHELAPIDVTHIDALVKEYGLRSRAELRPLVSELEGQVKQFLRQRAALNGAADRAGLVRLAHTLSSSARQLGAWQLAHACVAFEEQIQQGDQLASEALLNELERTSTATLHALSALIG